MKRNMAALVMACTLMTVGPVYATEMNIDSMSLEELRTAYTALESEKAELESENNQLESENADLKSQIEELKQSEAETETFSTEIVGTEYTDNSTIRIVQQALNEAGFNCGTPDGVAGSGTKAAIQEYQKSKKLNVNGVITDELLESLGVADKVSEEAKKQAQMGEYSSDYTYTQIARSPDSYKDTKVKFRGKVLQEGDGGSGLRYIRLAVNSDYDSVLFITYTSDQTSVKLLEDDIITVYGTVLGEYSYETVMGATVTLPWVHSDILDTSEVNMG